MQKTLQHVLFVAAVASVIMFSNLGGTRLWDRDEPRNSGCAAEMLARGDWIVPVFNGELRSHKPVLLYWLMMSAYSVFGVGEFGARFWSAALAVGSAVCTYAMGRRLFRPSVGIWAGVIVASAMMFDVAGRAATPDSCLIFCCTLAMTIYVLSAFPTNSDSRQVDGERPYFPSWAGALAMYAVMGVGMLGKGPIGLVVPTAVIGMFLLIMRLPVSQPESNPPTLLTRAGHVCSVFGPLHFLRTCWSMRPLTALAISLAVALPWYIWVGVRTDGEFVRGFFLEHNVGRAMQSMEGHGGSVFFYPVAILIGFFPWSVFAIPTIIDGIRHARKNTRWRVSYIFVACWAGVFVGIFTVARTKLPSYVTPCYPALALGTACFVDRWVREAALISRHWSRAAFSVSMLVGTGMLIALPFAANKFLPGDEWLAAIGLLPLCGGLAALILAERQHRKWAAGVYATAAVLFVTLMFGGIASRVDQHQRSDLLLSAIGANSDDPRIASFGLLEPSWVFYSGRAIDEISTSEDPGPMSSIVETDGMWVRKQRTYITTLLADPSDSFLITTDGHLQTLRERYPDQFEVIAEEPYFLKKGKLVVLRPVANDAVARDPSRSLNR